MLDKLISLLKAVCEAISVALAAYFYGKQAAEKEKLDDENKKLKQGLDAAMRGDYNRDSAYDRMRSETGGDDNAKAADTDKGDV